MGRNSSLLCGRAERDLARSALTVRYHVMAQVYQHVTRVFLIRALIFDLDLMS